MEGQVHARAHVAGVDRRDFIVRGAKYAAALAAASSLAALAASCADPVSTAPTAANTTEIPQSGNEPSPDVSARNTAAVDPATCRAYNGKHCLMCMSACRENAIYSQDGHPVVDGSRCTGCGKCRFACPTDPSSISVTASN